MATRIQETKSGRRELQRGKEIIFKLFFPLEHSMILDTEEQIKNQVQVEVEVLN